MARNTRQGTPSNKPKANSSKANAAGYLKRHSAKSSLLSNPANVYEYKQHGKVRRAKVTADLDREEAKEFAVGSNEEEEPNEKQARLIGENVDDEMIDSDDDEEIDSDAAWEETDEDTFAGSAFKKGKKVLKKTKSSKPAKLADVDLNENSDEEDDKVDSEESQLSDEEAEESGADEEFFDVLDVLDGRGKLSDDETSDSEHIRPKPQPIPLRPTSEDEETSEVDSDSEGSDGEDSEIVIDASDDDEQPEALGKLNNFISSLDTSRKRKPQEELDEQDEAQEDGQPQRRKRRIIKERTETGIESEFRASSSGNKLRLDDLLAPLSSTSSALSSLKQSTKALTTTAKGKRGVLAAPLAMRAQERLDREAAYGQTKEEVDKWSATMKRIKEAEHLSFPLQAEPVGRVSNLELAAKFRPTTTLETSIDSLLRLANLRDGEVAGTEALAMNHLSMDEVASRRGELRKMRELMFRAEIKAKRVAKIKSKTYRRIQKKQRARLGNEATGEGDDSADEKLKMETDRAVERATLRHKNTGKWAKQMKRKGGMDGDERKEMLAMLDRGEKLRRRIQGIGSDDEEEQPEDSDDEDENEFNDDGIMRIKQGAFEEIARLTAQDGETVPESSGKSKSIFEMKFMKDAMARQEQRVNDVADDFIKEMGGNPGSSDAEEEHASGVQVRRAGGRIVYRPGAPTTGPISISTRPIGSHVSDASSVTLKSTDLLSPPPTLPTPSPAPISSMQLSPVTEIANPWLVSSSSNNKAPRKKNEILVSKDSAALEKSSHKMNKKAKRREEEAKKGTEKDDAVVEISMDTVLSLNLDEAPKKNKKPKHKKKSASGNAEAQGDDSEPDNSELDEQERINDVKGKGKAKAPRAFEQRDLVALAFAGDNVVQDFEDAKRREMAADAPKEVDTTLAGWGSWGGTGTRKLPPKPHLIKKIAGVDPKSRADFNKSHVIISEKRDKKAAKYLVKDLPYPYTSQAQYERSMDTPIGAEWNTRVGFQRATMPKVVKKMGVVINPLEKLF